MLEPKELQKLGEKISADFLEENIPLTQGLQKVAEEYGLNKNQVHRVAETANVKTHLHMLKQASAEDAYITFEVANPSSVKSIEKIKKASFTFDYDTPPLRDKVLTDEPLFKVAEQQETPKSANALFQEATKVRDKLAHLQNKIIEGSIRLEDKLVPIYSLVKQAALGGTPKDSLSYIIKTAAPLGDYVIERLETVLEKDRINLPKEGLEKFANKQINPENELYQKIIDFNDEAVEILKKAEAYEEIKNNMPDHPILKRVVKTDYIGEKLAGVINFVHKHPVPSAGIAAYTIGRAQNIKIKESSPILEKNYIHNLKTIPTNKNG